MISQMCLVCLLAKQNTEFKWKETISRFAISPGTAEALVLKDGWLGFNGAFNTHIMPYRINQF